MSANQSFCSLLIAVCLGWPLIPLQGRVLLAEGLRSQTSRPATTGQRQTVTVPLVVEMNRPFIDLEFRRSDGSTRKARFWVDTGGGGFIVTERLARDLGLEFGEVVDEGGARFAATKPPSASVGGMPLNLDRARVLIQLGTKTIAPGVGADGVLPGHVLMRYQVVFDYPGRRFTLAVPGMLHPRGIRLASPIDQHTGFPRLEAQIGGEAFGFLLDTGASFTMISQEQISRWASAPANWKATTGAVGAANMGVGGMELNASMLRLPQLGLGTMALNGIAAVSRPKGTFERMMSRMMTAPIVGAIGGNVWRAFRVEIDYANGATYLEKSGTLDPVDLDVVGAIVSPSANGTYTLVGVAKQDGKEVTNALRGGDRLVKIGRLDVTGAPLAEVIEALHGKPGDIRTLVVEREQKPVTVKVPIVRVL